jgi:hypothetical protein
MSPQVQLDQVPVSEQSWVQRGSVVEHWMREP